MSMNKRNRTEGAGWLTAELREQEAEAKHREEEKAAVLADASLDPDTQRQTLAKIDREHDFGSAVRRKRRSFGRGNALQPFDASLADRGRQGANFRLPPKPEKRP